MSSQRTNEQSRQDQTHMKDDKRTQAKAKKSQEHRNEHTTEAMKNLEKYGKYYPPAGSSPSTVERFEEGRSKLHGHSYSAKDEKERMEAITGNHEAAKDREKAGIKGKDFAYPVSDPKHTDSKNQYSRVEN